MTGAQHEARAERQILTLRDRLGSLTSEMYQTLDQIQQVTDDYLASVQGSKNEGQGDAAAGRDR